MMQLLSCAVGALLLSAAVPVAAQTMPVLHRSAVADLPKVFAVRVNVADIARSEHFYREVFGVTGADHFPNGESMLHFPSGVNMMLTLRAAGSSPAVDGGPAGFIFEVSDIDAVIARVEAAGGRIVHAPGSGAASGGIRAGIIRDPDGAGIEVIQLP